MGEDVRTVSSLRNVTPSWSPAMGNIHDQDSAVLLQKLALLLPAWYAMLYLFAAVTTAVMGGDNDVGWGNYATLPFKTAKRDFSPVPRSSGRQHPYLPVAAWTSQLGAHLFGGLLIVYLVRNREQAWDFAVTAAFLHFLLSCGLGGEGFPLSWVWWITHIPGTAAFAVAGELGTYYLLDLREI